MTAETLDDGHVAAETLDDGHVAAETLDDGHVAAETLDDGRVAAETLDDGYVAAGTLDDGQVAVRQKWGKSSGENGGADAVAGISSGNMETYFSTLGRHCHFENPHPRSSQIQGIESPQKPYSQGIESPTDQGVDPPPDCPLGHNHWTNPEHTGAEAGLRRVDWLCGKPDSPVGIDG